MPESGLKKALLISYYWPPAGGPGVQRWLRFSKYLKSYGWELTVYTPQNPVYPLIDESLNQQISSEIKVIKHPIFEPAALFGAATGNKKGVAFVSDKKPGMISKLAIWFRGNYLIPDARKFWIKPSIAFLKDYLKQNPQDVIISTGPPHSMHLIALELRKSLPVKWLADFRDPWTEIDFYKELKLSNSADRKHKNLEKEVLHTADAVCTVSEQWASDLERIGKRNVETIGNGFEFEEFDLNSIQIGPEFTIAHFGSMPAARNPKALWPALAALVIELPDFNSKLKIRLVGNVDYSILEDIKTSGLEKYLDLIPQVSHAESLQLQRNSAVLLLVANDTPNSKGILTGKFYEYLGAARPILAYGPKGGNLETEVIESGAGQFLEYNQVAESKSTIKEWFLKFQNQELKSEIKSFEKYHSKSLAGKIAKLMDQISS